MLITVSGMVGSGKSTAVREVVSQATGLSLEAHSHRFQSLPCISFRLSGGSRGRKVEAPARSRTTAPAGTRWSGYRRKRLGAAAFAVFVARTLAFHVYRRTMWAKAECHVLNRYFYDSLCHYRLESRLERLFYGIVTRLIPRPDLAILVTAEPQTIAARRPGYAREYVELVGEAYLRLASDIPDLNVVSTEPGQPTAERLGSLLRTRLR